uniref:Nucleolar protein 3 n=1 Tax=Lynx canadensis TaxID=61383 RepID=A0A667HPA5_LYNCA
MGNAQERPSETIDRERKRLVETLQDDSGLLLDALLARGVLTGPEYEALDALPDAERRVRRLLLLVQSKGEAACQELLHCAQRTTRAPDPAWDWQHATGNAATTLHALATGRLRHLTGPLAPNRPELQTATRLGFQGARRQYPEPSRNSIRKWKLKSLKGLSQSWNPKWIRNQSQHLNWSQSQSQSPTLRRVTSLKIPECQSADRLLLSAQSRQDLGSCSGIGEDATKSPPDPVPLEVNKLRWVTLGPLCDSDFLPRN